MVDRWCAAAGIPRRPVVSLDQQWALALAWYGNRLTLESRRPAPQEMSGSCASLGLDGPFWDPFADRWG